MNLNQNYQNEVYIQRKEKRRIYKSGLLKQRIEKKSIHSFKLYKL